MPIVEKEWITKAGLKAVVTIVYSDNRPHHRCGYVFVDAGHPYHGKDYMDVSDISVHGGLTFSANAKEFKKMTGVDAGGDGTWFGFDCAHYCDAPIESKRNEISFGVVRSLDYVIEECEELAKQLIQYCIKEAM